jgi:hypothetical protein
MKGQANSPRRNGFDVPVQVRFRDFHGTTTRISAFVVRRSNNNNPKKDKNMNVRDLQEKRALLIGEMRQITSKPTGNGGELSADQATQFEQLKGEVETLEDSIKRQQFLEDAERRAAGQQIHGSGDARLDEEMRNFSIRKAICSGSGSCPTG